MLGSIPAWAIYAWPGVSLVDTMVYAKGPVNDPTAPVIKLAGYIVATWLLDTTK